MPRAYYNEIDPYAAQWLRNLIGEGHIAHGDVDERDIRDVYPSDLHGYTQCHFFAGVGVWSLALRRAGWADDRPVWTGSCPCQPFSAAGRRSGMLDERHLWPAFHHLIEQRRPPVVFGEQVASKDGLGWLDLVQADMEGTGYAVGAADLCAAGVGAPHWRQRLWFVAEALGHAGSPGLAQRERFGRVQSTALGAPAGQAAKCGSNASRLGHSDHNRGRWDAGGFPRAKRQLRQPDSVESAIRNGRMADTDGSSRRQGREVNRGRNSGSDEKPGAVPCSNVLPEHVADSNGRQQRETRAVQPGGEHGLQPEDRSGMRETDQGPWDGADRMPRPGPTNGFWRDADWIFCRDGKWRPVEPGTFPLAHGSPARVGRLRAYGNGIVSEAAVTFILSYLDVLCLAGSDAGHLSEEQ